MTKKRCELGVSSNRAINAFTFSKIPRLNSQNLDRSLRISKLSVSINLSMIRIKRLKLIYGSHHDMKYIRVHGFAINCTINNDFLTLTFFHQTYSKLAFNSYIQSSH